MKHATFQAAATINDNGEPIMNMNRFWPAIALAVTLVLTACGGDGGGFHRRGDARAQGRRTRAADGLRYAG